MKTTPILFSAPMVRALLDGSKTQTRRAMNPQPVIDGETHSLPRLTTFCESEFKRAAAFFASKFGQPGDQLWVRETFCLDDNGHEEWPVFRADGAVLPARPGTRKPARWVPSIHMPRVASRINLEIVSVRVEHLQEISEADALAEGITHSTMNDPRVEYRWL